MSTPVIPYRSADFACQMSGRDRIKYPLPPTAPNQFAAFALDQDMAIASENYPPAPRNTPLTDSVFGLSAYTPPEATESTANAILTSLSQPSDAGAALARFTGTFHIVPAAWDSFANQRVDFPGWLNYVYSGKWRNPKSVLVTVRTRHDYFVLDPDGVLTGAGIVDSGGSAITIVASEGAVPIKRRTPWLVTYAGSAVDQAETKSLVAAAGVPPYLPTLPSTEQYQAWAAIASALYAGVLAGTATWDNTHPPVWNGTSSSDVTSGQFILENSNFQNYAGNIIERLTTYALVE